MVVTSTKGSPGSFQRTVANVGANIKNIFSGSPQAVIDTATGTYGTPSEVSNAPRRPGFVSGGGGGGGSAPAASGETAAVLTPTGIITAPATQVVTKGITAESIRRQAIQIQSARRQQEQRQAIIDGGETDIRSFQKGTIDPTQLTIQQRIQEDIKQRGQKATEWLITPIKPIEKFKQKYIETPSILESFAPQLTPGAELKRKVEAEFIPKTPLDIGLTTASIGLYAYAPAVIRVGIAGYSTYAGTKAALSPSLKPEQRIAGGITAALGLFGTSYEIYPYARGVKARLSPDYIPVKTQPEGFKAIQNEALTLGLIPEKSPLQSGVSRDVKLPGTSPLVRGGFGVKQSEKALFLGEDQILATSQRSFFKPGKSITIKREFFVTPQEPTLNIPETRISRLGLFDLFKSSKPGEISFGFPTKAQIGLIKAGVGRIETASRFKIGGTSELEAIKTYGTIQDIGLIGKTIIKGQGVDIYGFKIGTSGITGKSIKTSTTATTRTTSIYGLLSSIPSTSTKTTETKSISLKDVLSYPTTTKTSKPTIPKTYGESSATPKTPTYSELSIYSITSGKSPEVRMKILKSKPSIPIRRATPKYYSVPKQQRTMTFKSITKVPKNIFSVSVRRGGKFRHYGKAPSLKEAFGLGKSYTLRTLGATFKVEGAGRIPQAPKGFYSKQEKGQTIFIQKRRGRISSRGEKEEITLARALSIKPRKRRKK